MATVKFESPGVGITRGAKAFYPTAVEGAPLMAVGTRPPALGTTTSGKLYGSTAGMNVSKDEI